MIPVIERIAAKYSRPINIAHKAIALLKAYHWVKEADDEELTDAAIRRFREWVGLSPEGGLDEQMDRILAMPRCGCPDHMEVQAATMNPWKDKGISVVKWGVTEFLKSNQFTWQDQLDILNMAVQGWKDVCGLQAEYVQNPSQAHVQVGLANRSRGSDGVNGMLAYTYLATMKPPIPLLMDVAEPWAKDDRSTGIPMSNVLKHEFGHVLINLTHSSPSDSLISLMDPYMNRKINSPQKEDIERAIKVWGEPAHNPPSVPAAPSDGADQEFVVTGGTLLLRKK